MVTLWLATICGQGASPPKQSATSTNVLRLLSRVLEQAHYSHHPFDHEISVRFLDRYLDSLDSQHLSFLQSDIDEFRGLARTLSQATKAGNITPARRIYDRFQKRIGQRVDFSSELLKSEKFEFNTAERYVLDRKNEPWPRNLEEARQLWRQRTRFEYLQEILNGKPPAEVTKTLARRYQGLRRTVQEMAGDDLIENWLNALANAYDPHSVYLGHEPFETLNISMKLSLVGIGVELTMEDGYAVVNRVMPGPAARSGQVKPGDRLLSISQPGKPAVEISDLPLSKVVELIRGPKGSKVQITLSPGNAPDPSLRKTLTLAREEIKLEDQEAKARLVELPGADGQTRRLGIIDLPSFYEDMEARKWLSAHKSTTDDVAKLLKKLTEENIDGLILDLRNNGGGSLQEAIGLTSLFIKKGPVVQVKDVKEKVSVYADKKRSPGYDGPMVVLTSRGSASASEIVAGALQDYGRALIVGDPSTYGKGTVQSVIALAPLMREFHYAGGRDPGGLVMTIEKFYRPGGASTQLRGVLADIIVPSTSALAETGESALPNPLEWDSVPAAPFVKQNRIEPYLAPLRGRFEQRIDQNREFAYVREDMARLRSMAGKKYVSLNEMERRKEKKEIQDRLAARKQERAASRAPEEKVFEITLRNASTPGLPPAIGRTNAMVGLPRRGLERHQSTELLDDEAMAGPDLTLKEGQHILLDYLELLATGKSK